VKHRWDRAQGGGGDKGRIGPVELGNFENNPGDEVGQGGDRETEVGGNFQIGQKYLALGAERRQGSKANLRRCDIGVRGWPKQDIKLSNM